MLHNFWLKFDKKKFLFALKFTLIILLIIIIFNIVDVTYSRYESSANMNIESDIAFFLVDVGSYNGSIALEGLEPSSTPYIYLINVKNYNSSNRTEVDLKYNISFESTTNLPLEISVYRNENYSSSATNIISSTDFRTDDDVYYKVYNTLNQNYEFHHNADESDYYTVVINFPEQYKNNPDAYQGKIDLFTIIVTAEQVV